MPRPGRNRGAIGEGRRTGWLHVRGAALMVQDRSLSSCQTLRPSQPTGCAGIATLTGVRASGIPHAEASRDGCSETARAHRHHASRGREQTPVQSPEPGAPGLGGKHPQLMAKDEDLDLTITRFAFGSARRSNPRRIRYRIETSTRACYGIDVTVREARVSDPLRRRRTWRSSARAAGGKPGGVGGGRSRSPLVVCGQSVSVVEDQSVAWERDLAHGLVVARSPYR